MTDEATPIDMLYIDAEHFDLFARSQPPLQPREQVEAAGRPFPGLPKGSRQGPGNGDIAEPATEGGAP